jgi:hypothetical protein
MNAAKLIVAIEICWRILTGISGCGRDSPPPMSSSRPQEIAELQKKLAESRRQRSELQKEHAELRRKQSDLEKARAESHGRRLKLLESLAGPEEAILEYELRTLEATPDWLKVERGMQADEWIRSERGMKADQRPMRDGPTMWLPVPDLSNPRLPVQPGADGRD